MPSLRCLPMRGDLPPIPDEAVAALRALWDSDHAGKYLTRDEFVAAWLGALWGPMYAAALRHAADKLDAVWDGSAGRPGFALRNLARESAP